MALTIHPFYEAHRAAMEAAMRQRLALAQEMLRGRALLSDMDGIGQEVMDEFAIVLTQMPYVGGAFAFGINYTACGFCKFAARHPPGAHANLGRWRKPLQFSLLAAGA